MTDRSLSGEPDWAALAHASGPAVDTPTHHLRTLRSANTAVRRKAWSDLIGSANHQGDLYPITPWIIGPLVDLAVDPDYPDRVAATAHVTLIVEDLVYSVDRPDNHPTHVAAHIENPKSEEKPWLIECRKVAMDRASDVIGLCEDDDPEIRVWALRLVGVVARASGAGTSLLQAALTDPDPRIRAVALWQLLITVPDQREVATLAAGITTETANDRLDYFMANVAALAGNHRDSEAAREVVRLQNVVWPEFERAELHHVAESPLVFAAVLTGVGSEIELDALAR